jgi:hypothetical protein
LALPCLQELIGDIPVGTVDMSTSGREAVFLMFKRTDMSATFPF